MVVAAQQPSAACTAIFTIYFVEHRPHPCAVIMRKACTEKPWNGYQNIVRIQYQRSMCWQHTKHFELSQFYLMKHFITGKHISIGRDEAK